MGHWAIVTTAIAAAAMLLLADRKFRAYLLWQKAVRMRAQAKPVLDRRLEQLDGRIDLAALGAMLAEDLTNRDTTAAVVDRAGTQIAAATPLEGPSHTTLPATYYEAAADDPHVQWEIRHDKKSVLVALVPPHTWRPDPPAIVQLAGFLDDELRLLRFARTLVLGLLGVTAIAAALEILLAGPYTLLALVAVPLVLVAARLARGRESPPAGTLDRVGDVEDTQSAGLRSALRTLESDVLVHRRSEERIRQFLADASHELRTPLTPLIGAVELLTQALDNREEAVRLIDALRAQTHRLERLVEDMLILARLDAEQNPRRERVRLDVLAAEYVDQLQLVTPERRIELVAPRPVRVLGDGEQLRRLLENLTSNAVRHTQAGGCIVVGVDARDRRTTLTVADDGEGIDEDDLPWIFERFYRGDSARRAGGSGLGLAIVRQISQAHGGVVFARSIRGEGATFRVELPLASGISTSRPSLRREEASA